MISFKKQISIIFLLTFWGLKAQEKKTFKELFEASLVVTSDVSYEFSSEKLQKNELILKPEFLYKLNRNTRFVLKAQLYNEFNDNLENGTPKEETVSGFSKRFFIGDRTNIELREFYFYTTVFKKWRTTIGKQQIVWGETDGLKLLDVVNPQNFREFVLDDFEDSRIPLWSVKTEFNIKGVGVQIVWIPDNTYHITQDFSAPFFTKNLFQSPPEGIPVIFNNPIKPKRFIADSDIGVKLSAFTKGWDISLNYFHYYDDLPVFYTDVLVDGKENPSIQINPKFERQHLLGTTFNKAFGSSTLRGEIAYIFDQNFISENSSAVRGIETSNQFKSAVGLDYIKGESVVSLQLFSDWVINNISPYNRNSFETNTSLQLSQEMINDNLKVEVLWVQNINHGDGYITPKLSYWLNTNLQLFLGSTIFYGDVAKLFGQFKDRNRISIGVKWGI